MIESFLYATWIGGQILYWSFLRYQTQFRGALYWAAFELRFGKQPMEGE